MELKDILLLFGGALLGYLVQLGGDRWRNLSDDYEIWAAVETLTIEVRHGGIGKGLEYAWKGRTVEHPHITDLYVWSVGRKDITSSQFDAGRSLTLNLGAPIVGELEGGKFVGLEESNVVVDPDGRVVINPSIIRRRMAGHYRFITDGDPKLSISNPVANLARVRQFDHERMTPARRSLGRALLPIAWAGLSLTVIGVFGSILLNSAMGISATETMRTPMPFGVQILVFGGILISAVAGLARAIVKVDPRKVSRALHILRRSLGEKDALASDSQSPDAT